jgi:hypothetical protein
MLKMIAPASNMRGHLLVSPGPVDVGEPFNGGAHEMPRPRVEGAVKIRDELVLGEVEFDVAEEMREQQPPELLGCEALLS